MTKVVISSLVAGVVFLVGAAGRAAVASWDSLTAAGNKAMQEKKFPYAEKSFKEALAQAEKFDLRDPRLPESLDNLALAKRAQKHYSEAEPLYLRSFELRKKALLSGDPLLSMSLSNLMIIYELEGKDDAAANLYDNEKAISQYVEAVKCEFCGSREKLVPVFYGTPTAGIKELAKRGKVRLGGPKPAGQRAQWFCTTCDALLTGGGKQFKSVATAPAAKTKK